MATSEFWQRVSATVSSSRERKEGVAGVPSRVLLGTTKMWMIFDGMTVLTAATLATLYKSRTGPLSSARGFWNGTLIHGRPMGILLALLCGFSFALIAISRRSRLYFPTRLTGFLHEQRLSVQACLTSGLLLAGTLYLIHADDIPRSIVLITVGLVTVALSLRRLVYRLLLYRRFERGVGTRNVLIVGTGPEAHALRHHMESIRHLGYTFKGFIDLPNPGSGFTPASGDVVGTLDTLFQNARKQFVDEIFSPLTASSASSRTFFGRPVSTAWICVWSPKCTMAWLGTAPSSTSANFPPSHCTAAMFPRSASSSSASSTSFFQLWRSSAFRHFCSPSLLPSNWIRPGPSSTTPSASAKRASFSAASSFAPWCAMRKNGAPTCCI